MEYNPHKQGRTKKYKETPLFLTDDESGFENILDKVQITPIKVLSPNKSHKDEKVTKETTVGNLLLEAMNNLEVSTKKKRLNQSASNSSINTFKTPQMTDKRITRSMKTSVNYENISIDVKSNESQVETQCKRISKNILNDIAKIECTKTTITIESAKQQPLDSQEINETEAESDIKLLTDRIVTSKSEENEETTKQNSESNVVTNSIDQSSNFDDSLNDEPKASTSKNIDENDTLLNNSKLKPSKFVLSWSKPNTKKINDSKETKKLKIPAPKKRPQVIADSIRRKSIMKLKSNDQYKTLAESVSKFQKETPKRFHSVPVKNAKPITTKQSTMKITRPISPKLMSKSRIRPIKPLDTKTSNSTLKNLRNGPVKADPKVTIPAKLKQTKKNIKIENFQSKKGHSSSTESLSSTNLHDSQHFKIDHPVQKKVVPTIVSTDDAKLAVKEVEIGHFGIPTDTTHKQKKITRTMPFNFEIRNKELQQKKELQLKKKQLQEIEKKIDLPGSCKNSKDSIILKKKIIPLKLQEVEKKTILPSQSNKDTKEFLKKKITPLKNPREISSAKKTTPRPFSFEERDKQLIKKKEDLIKETHEKERKGREFHANPVPVIRPVIVRGRSRENLRINNEKTPEKNDKINKVTSAPQICHIKKTLFPKIISNQENKEPNGKQFYKSASSEKLNLNNGIKKTAILGELKLNTDKRARERKEYEDRVRMKELREEEIRKNLEQERLIREKEEIAELRKIMETKARPVPKFKPLAIIKSTKILTDPQSPAWAHKHKKI